MSMVEKAFHNGQNFIVPALLVSLIIFFLPFYEGGARPESLFVVHTGLFVIGLYLGIQALKGTIDFLFMPRAVLFFIPFFIYLLIRSFFSPYLYASLLSLWEIFVFFFLLALTFHFSQQRGFLGITLFSVFLSTTLQAFLAILFFLLGGFKRSAVYFLNPNHLAAYLLLGFFLGIFLLVTSLKAEEKEKKQAKILIPCLIIIIASFIIESSRGAFLSFALAFLILLASFFLKGKKKESIIALVLFIVVALAGSFFIYQRFKSGLDIYRYERLRIWSASLGVLYDNFAFGVGPGMFEYHSQNYSFPQLSSPVRYGRIFSSPHSDYILVLTELGMTGFILFFLPFLYTVRSFFKKKDCKEMAKITLLCILAAFLAQSFFDNLTGRPALYMSMAIIIGALLSCTVKADFVQIRLSSLRRGIAFTFCFLVPIAYLWYCAVFFPFLSDFLIKKSKGMVAEKKEAEALKYCNGAIFFNQIHPDYYRIRGEIRMEMLKEGKHPSELFPSCEEDFSRASALNKIDASYLLDRAELSMEMMDRGFSFDELYSDSLQFYKKAEELAQKSPFIPFDLAVLFYENGDLQNAEKECVKSITIEPCYFQAALLLVQIYIDIGDAKRATGIIEGMERRFKEIDGYKVKNQYEFNVLNYDRKRFMKLKESLDKDR